MFATLVIMLPSIYEGGELIVHHAGKHQVFDFAAESAHSAYFIAFYCDCEHEILPIRSGYRLCLVYNLIWRGSKEQAPTPPGFETSVKSAISILQRWQADPSARSNLCYVLDHQYTEAELSFERLKTRDRIVANLLRSISKVIPLDCYLAALELHQTGYPPEWDSRGYRGNLQMEVNESTIELTGFVSLDEADETVFTQEADNIHLETDAAAILQGAHDLDFFSLLFLVSNY
jgi:hypothetical protein